MFPRLLAKHVPTLFRAGSFASAAHSSGARFGEQEKPETTCHRVWAAWKGRAIAEIQTRGAMAQANRQV